MIEPHASPLVEIFTAPVRLIRLTTAFSEWANLDPYYTGVVLDIWSAENPDDFNWREIINDAVELREYDNMHDLVELNYVRTSFLLRPTHLIIQTFQNYILLTQRATGTTPILNNPTLGEQMLNSPYLLELLMWSSVAKHLIHNNDTFVSYMGHWKDCLADG